MDTTLIIIIIGIVIAFLFDFLNGMNDAANSIATIVATKVLTPFQAVLWAAFLICRVYLSYRRCQYGGKGIEPKVMNSLLFQYYRAVLWVFLYQIRIAYQCITCFDWDYRAQLLFFPGRRHWFFGL